MKSRQHIKQLCQKYLDNSCTPTESEAFLRLLQSGEEQAYIQELIENHLQKKEIHREANIVVHRVFQKLELTQPEPSNAAKKKKYPFYYLAAAVILIACSVATYMFYFQQSAALPAVSQLHDADPGSDKAVLLLADGTAIHLDEVDRGILADKDGLTIIKSEDGLLTVQPSNNQSRLPETHTISTPRGGQYQVLLPDGTKVWLNASSSLSFPSFFGDDERRVTLNGEGYFEVAESNNGNRPSFFVETASQQIEVLGTHFNVNAYADEKSTNTTLIEGNVRIITLQRSTLLKPGQQSQVDPNGSLSVTPIDLETVMAWKNGDFIFVDEDIPSIMRKISRWYNVDVVFMDNLLHETYNAQISREKKLSEVLQILRLSGGIFTEIKDSVIYVSSQNELKNQLN